MHKIVAFLFLCYALIANQCEADKKSKNDVRSYFKKLAQKNETLSNTCTECKFIVAELKHVLDDPQRLDEIKIVLKSLCELMGGTEAEQCKNIVDNLDVLIERFKPYLDNPELFCKELHLCGQSNVGILNRLILLEMKMIVRRFKKRPTKNDFLCDECVFAINELNNMLQSPDVQQDLKQQLEGICGIFSSIEKQCDQLIEEYFPQIIQALENFFKNPKQLCVAIDFCQSVNVPSIKLFKPSTSNIALKSMPHARRIGNALKMFAFMVPQLQTSNGNNAMCLFCEVGLESIITKMKQNSKLIANKTSSITCNMLPRDARPSCFDFTRIYADSLVKMLVDEWSPEEICKYVHMCTNESNAAIKSMTTAQRAEAACDACHTLTEFISYEFKQPPFQQEVVTMVKQKICSNLPGDLANQCLDQADQFVPMIMQQIAEYVSREAFCRDLGLC